MVVFWTKHAIERLSERFPEIFEPISSRLKDMNSSDARTVLNQLLNQSEEDKSYKNNVSKMMHIYETYGYDLDYQIKVDHSTGMELILAKRRSEKQFRVVTIIQTRKKKSLKYNTHKTKEERQKDYLLNVYTNMCNVSETWNKSEPDQNDRNLRFELGQALTRNMDAQLYLGDYCEFDLYLVTLNKRQYLVDYDDTAGSIEDRIISKRECFNMNNTEAPETHTYKMFNEMIEKRKNIIEQLQISKHRHLYLVEHEGFNRVFYAGSGANGYYCIILSEHPLDKYI